MAGGWDPTTAEVRPGLYINFLDAAVAQVAGGARGVVALPLATYDGTAVEKTIYNISKETEAVKLFGAGNLTAIKLILQGKASSVLVYTLPAYDAETVEADHVAMYEAFDAYPFNVFVFDGEVTNAQQLSALAWMKGNREEGKHFEVVFGGSSEDDRDPSIGNARSITLSDDYAVNLISGVTVGETEYNSSVYAAYIAGLIAGTPINKAITYATVDAEDVTKRLTNSEIKAALQAGSLVLVNNGNRVRVEQGLQTSGAKIRKMRARQAIETDLTTTAAESYIGQIDNHVDGQKALIAAVKAYLERLATSSVLTEDITVELSSQYPSVGDSVYVDIEVTEVDSMEKLYFTIKAN